MPGGKCLRPGQARREPRSGAGRAANGGELRPGANLDVAVSALVGAFFARYLAGEPIGGRFMGALVDSVLDGVRLSPKPLG